MHKLKTFLLNPKQALIVIIAVSVLIRVAGAIYLTLAYGNVVVELPGTFDQVSYHNLAIRLLDGHGFSFGEQWWPATRPDEPTAHWSYLYTLYLALVYAIFGVNPVIARIIQGILVGILMPWLTYQLGIRVFAESERKEPISLMAAAITAVYIYFFYYAAALMTESFYILTILWAFILVLDMRQAQTPKLSQWLWLGVALGTAVLLRQLFLLVIPFILLWVWWATRPRFWLPALPLMIVGLMILPWTIRNYIVFEQLVLLNTNAGYAFYWGNHPIYGTRFVPILTPEMGSYYSLLPPELLHLNEAALDTALLGLALENIFSDFGRYILLSLSRIPPYFMFWPSAQSSLISNVSRVASFGLFLPFMVVGLVRSFHFTALQKWLQSPLFLLYLFMLVYTGIHVLTWTLIRYRLPVDAILVLFASFAIVELGQWLLQKRGPSLS